MTPLQLMLAEIWHRKANFVLSILAVVVATTLFVASPTIMRGYGYESDQRLAAMHRETATKLEQMQEESAADIGNMEKRTRRIMRDLGFNLRIVHRNTDMAQFHANFVAFDMPEEYLQLLANAPEITKIVHLVATVKQMIEIDGSPRLVIGYAPEATQSHIEKKAPMGYQVKPGEVFLGSVAAAGYKIGDKIDILGQSFKVARILEEHGSRDEDIAIMMDLRTAQKLLGKEGRLSEIVALGCKCKTVERIEEIRAQLEGILPEARVMEISTRAIARDKQRKLLSAYHQEAMEKYTHDREQIVRDEQEGRQGVISLLSLLTGVITPLVVLACAMWIGFLAWANTRERRTEIGLLRALGKRSAAIAAIFLGKAVLLGVAGGVFGSLLGMILAQWAGMRMFAAGGGEFSPSATVLIATILGAPLVSAMASYLPTLAALRQDPAVVLLDN